MSTERTSKNWAVVLAAGEGRRLSSLTAALYGSELPKQFAVIDGARSLLQATLDRIAPLIPPERTVVVVGQEHGTLARTQLRGYPGVDVVLQPKNLDTGPGILLPLARILATDPDARVAIFPSDHHVANPAPFLAATTAALSAAEAMPDLVALIGVVPDRPETEYGWILPGTQISELGDTALRDVLRFVEKPAPDVAQGLLARGGLWNTFVSVAKLSALWGLAAQHLPTHAALFDVYAGACRADNEASVLQAIYAEMQPANFSRSVLERAESLSVLPVEGCGWSDWGTPERVFQSLAGLGRLDSLRQRIALRDPVPAAM